MRSLALVAVLAFVVSGALPRGPAHADAPSGSEVRYATFPDASVRIIQPDGFELAEQFPGLVQESTTASVMVTALPAPYREVAPGFTDEALAAKGVRVIKRESVEIDANEGLLFHARQNAAGIDFTKWMLVVGNDSSTKIVTAAFPTSGTAKLSETLKGVVLSVRFVEMPGPHEPVDVGFTVVPSKKLRPNPNVRGMGKVLSYSINPVAESPSEPFFTATQSQGPIIGFEREQFAVYRVKDLGKIQGTSIVSKTRVDVDGLQGFEVVAKGKDVETSTPMVIYEMILFRTDDSYYLMVGAAGSSLAGEYLPEFRKMARSFKRAR